MIIAKLTIVILITIILVLKIFDTTKDKDKLELIRDYLRPALELYDISINLPDTFSPKEGKRLK